MLSDAEYESLRPHRDKIMAFATTHNYKGDAMHIIDKIRQARGWGSICFECTGSKANALNDAISLIQEYEENIAKNTI